ncbi:MAG: N-acetylmuramoyl-L-alanine amidase [Oscillospiraceae bacterium]|nr:N-acetylmuramoyl-L-alanine amidase [Oscillospiraceae bacterium]
MAKKRKRKLRIDRIVILLVFLAAIIFILTKIVSCTVSVFRSGKDTSGSSSTDEQVFMSNQSSSEVDTADKFTVVIDAGHGGDDAGAVDPQGTRYEKDDVLEIALLVESELAEYGDINVVMTRSDDTFLSLDERCAVANDIDADLFVSIHRNSADIGNGVEIWINSENNSDDKLLAQKILSKFPSESISQSRGIKEGYRDDNGNEHNYYVNSATTMPSCLVELGFITDENDNLLFDGYKNEYAKAIADGIIDAANVLELYSLS